MAAKDQHRERMVKYWGDPDNDFITRFAMHTDILGITGTTFYKHFTPDEVCTIESEALDLRLKNSSRDRAKIYKSLLKEAEGGSVKAAKEFLDRTEGKVKEKLELTGKDGKDLVPIINVTTTGNKR